jgi:Spy/CpxP family protein refolding chaperone
MSAGLVAAAIAAASGAALSQGGYGPGMMGPGMMGPGMMGPGMMGPGMTGPGMGGGMMAPGMMGPGMGGGMMAPGMMGGGHGMAAGYAALDLSDEQRQKLAALGEQARTKSWDAMGKLRAEQYRLRELLRADPVDASAVIDQQAKVDGLRRDVLRSRVESRNDMAAVLTAEQRRKLRDGGPWWYRDDAVE